MSSFWQRLRPLKFTDFDVLVRWMLHLLPEQPFARERLEREADELWRN